MSDWPKYNPEAALDGLWEYYQKTMAENRALWDAVERVRGVCEQQVKDRSAYSDDRNFYGPDYIDGWNDALDRVEQVNDGGTPLLMALSPAMVQAAVACVHRCCPDDAPVMLDALGLAGGAVPVGGPLAYDGHVRFGRGR